MFKTLAEIRKKSKEYGGHFFDRCHKSKYNRKIYGGHFFIVDCTCNKTGKYSHSLIAFAMPSGRIFITRSGFTSNQYARDEVPYYVEILETFLKGKEKTEQNLWDFYSTMIF